MNPHPCAEPTIPAHKAQGSPDTPFLPLGMNYFIGSALVSRLCSSGQGLCLLYPQAWHLVCVQQTSIYMK